MTFIVSATLVQTSLFMTFTVPAVQCHLPVHICSNLLVHDLHCISNLSSNLLVHDLHCTSCAVSPTSSSLRFSKLCFFLSTSATSPRSTFLCVRNNRLCASAFWAAMLRRLSLALGKIHAHFHYLSALTHLLLTVHAKTREHSQGYE